MVRNHSQIYSPKESYSMRAFHRLTVVLLAGLMLLGGPGAASGQITLQVALSDNDPLGFFDKNGNPAGFYVDLLNYTAEQEGWQLTYISLPHAEMLTQADQGQIDIIATIGHTEAFARRFVFIEETLVNNWGGIYVQNDSEIETLLDLDGKSIAVLEINSHADRLRELLDEFKIECQFTEVGSFTEVAELIHTGAVDGGVLNRLVGHNFESAYNIEATAIVFNPIDVRIAVSPHSPAFVVEKLDQHIAALKQNPGSLYYQSLDQWLGAIQPAGTPEWHLSALYGGSALIGILLLTTLFLRIQVRRRTADLRAKNQALESEIRVREETEQALRESEEQFRALAEYSPVAISIIRGDHFLYVNQAWAELTGYTISEAHTLAPYDVVHPEARDLSTWSMPASESPSHSLKILTKDGQTKWLNFWGAMIEYGGDSAILIVNNDITQRVQTEASLRASEQALKEYAHDLELLNKITTVAATETNFDTMLERLAAHICEIFSADDSLMTLWDAATEKARIAAAYGSMSDVLLALDETNFNIPLTQPILQAKSTIVIDDVAEAPHIPPELAAQFPTNSLVALPLTVGEQLLGTVFVGFNQPHTFEENEIDRGQQAVAQIALAVAKAQLIEETRRSATDLEQANRDLSILNLAHAAISATLGMDEVLHIVTQQMSKALNVDGCAISLLRRPENTLEILIDYSKDYPENAEPAGRTYSLSEFPATAHLLENHQPLVIHLNDPEADKAELAYMKAQEISTLLMLPLIAGDRVFGLVELYIELPAAPRYFTPRDIQMGKNLAVHAASAIENAQLFDQLQHLTALLEQRVDERTAELAARVDEVEQLNSAMTNLLQDVQTANYSLEVRTMQLQEANQEMEAFAYSVSHDLRAPLRHINGFTQLLLDREAENLDPTSKRFLDNISASSDRMSLLIDDLLRFSRTSRTEMALMAIEMEQVIEKARKEIISPITDRLITWKFGNLPQVFADPALMGIVWTNLIANAVKYSAPKDKTIIEIGSLPPKEGHPEIVFFIRDNGVGFDPKYTDKLFGVFQRLHQKEEFEGTGIGLATVRRIIHRHGGRVWAEGQVNKGSTFYFSLPTEQ